MKITVVYPSNAHSAYKVASNNFIDLVKQVSGDEITAVTDSEYSSLNDSDLIVLIGLLFFVFLLFVFHFRLIIKLYQMNFSLEKELVNLYYMTTLGENELLIRCFRLCSFDFEEAFVFDDLDMLKWMFVLV